jgi:hypothetical protein
MLVMALGLSLLFNGHNNNETTWLIGLGHSLFVGIFFISTSFGVNLLYQQIPFKLWLIDAGYQIVLLATMGIIIGAW